MDTAQHNDARHIYAGLEQLNQVTDPQRQYRIRRENGHYILVNYLGGEYPPRTAIEIRNTLINLRVAAVGK